MYQDKPRDGVRHADRWVALLRIAVGLWFLRGGFRKVTLSFWGGFVPLPAATDRWVGFMPKKVAEFAAGNPPTPSRPRRPRTVSPGGGWRVAQRAGGFLALA